MSPSRSSPLGFWVTKKSCGGESYIMHATLTDLHAFTTEAAGWEIAVAYETGKFKFAAFHIVIRHTLLQQKTKCIF